jgi:hypothetical protein
MTSRSQRTHSSATLDQVPRLERASRFQLALSLDSIVSDPQHMRGCALRIGDEYRVGQG